MKKIAKIALIVTLALVSAKAKVRDPLRSVFKIKQKYGMWMMHAKFSLSSLRSAMDLHFSGMDLYLLSKEALHEKMLEYIVETIAIQIDGVTIQLSRADLQIKEDRVDVMWTLDGVPQDIIRADIRIKTCAELDLYSNVLKFEKGATIHQYFLSADNSFEIAFEL